MTFANKDDELARKKRSREGIVLQWVALLPLSSRVPGLNLSACYCLCKGRHVLRSLCGCSLDSLVGVLAIG